MGLVRAADRAPRTSRDTRRDLEQIRVARRPRREDRPQPAAVRAPLGARAIGRRPQRDRAVDRRAAGLRAASLGVELEEHYSLELPLIVVNREEIQQVILNLLMNAEHAVAGDRAARRRARPHRRERRLRVDRSADNGPGVPPDVASQVFEPFFTTKGVGAGNRPRPVGQPRHRRGARRHARTQADRQRRVLPPRRSRSRRMRASNSGTCRRRPSRKFEVQSSKFKVEKSRSKRPPELTLHFLLALYTFFRAYTVLSLPLRPGPDRDDFGVALGHFFPAAGASMKPLGDAFIKLVRMIVAPSSSARSSSASRASAT